MDRYRSAGGRRGALRVEIVWILIVIARIVSGQDFKIDSQLRIVTNDCYTRIAIGSRLPKSSGFTTVSGNELADCESVCSSNRSRCNVFDFGVDGRGNRTCTIGRLGAGERLEDLPIDPDYDVYERRRKNPTGCDHDRLVKIGYAGEIGNATGSLARPRNATFGRRREPGMPFGNSFFASTKNLSKNDRQPSFFRGGWSGLVADDEDTRLYDILNVRKPFRGFKSWNLELPSPSNGPYGPEDHTDLCAKFSGTAPLFCKSSLPIFYHLPVLKPSEDSEPRYRNVLPGSTDFSNDFGPKIDPVLEKSKACYRKLLSGKRILDSHVRRNVPCERIEECHRVCEYESAFVCEGFNYGRMEAGPNYGRSPDGDTRRGYMCQLTSVSDGRMDPRRDFVDDPRYDYYARDWSCPAGKVHRERAYGGGPSSHLPGRRPSDQSDWRPMSFPPSAAPGRPFDPPAYGDSTRSYYPPGRYVPTRNRPGDYDRYASDDRQRPWGSYLPRGTPFHNEIGQHRYYYGDRDYYPNRRVDDQRFWPRQPAPGPNDIVEPNHPPYGRSYGYGTHYYPYQRSKDHPVPDPYEYWPKTRGPPRKPTILEPPERHYGSNYGPAYGYHSSEALPDDSYRPTWKPRHRQPWLGTDRKDCSVRSLMGFKITRKIVVASHATANLEECEMLCSARTDCFSFAYRYSLVATAPTDNCLLSNLPFDRLNFYTDLEPERDYDVYAIVGDPKRCQESKKPDDAQVGPHRRSSEECFWRVQSGCGMPPSLTRKKIRAENGLGECQIACITARHFTCRSFVFRYDSEGDRDPNCFLSDCPTTEIIAAIEADTSLIVPGRDLELYERGSYGRGCEASPFTPIYNSANIGDKKRPPDPGPGDCWSAYRAGCKLAPSAVSSMSRVDSEVECRRQCSRMRYNQHSPTCMSFSFRLGDEKRGDNCYLSDVPRRDLRPGLDYSYDDDYVTYAWKELEPQCSAPPGPGYDYAPPSGVKFNYDSGAADYRPGDPPNAPPPAPGHAGPGLYTYNTLFLGVRPLDSGRPDAATPPEHPTSTYLPNDETSGDGFPGPDYTDGIGSFNRHYTVNGYPCKRGTKCEVNKIAGFWSCEPEGSEFGSWDYCCEPNHHCGFSQGYNYPWCYVGASEEQWRPCSEKYYPYLPSPRPAINRSPTSDYYFNTGNDRNGNRGFYRSEGSGRSEVNSRNCCGARHWPIAFLHPVPPPNTTDSVALANDRRDSSERDVNKTGESSGSTTPGRLDRDKNASSTTEETVNSSIIRIQPYKSHLKRRGLVSPSSTTNRTKAWHKKFHRISIRPANSNGNISLDTTIANHENEFRVNKIHDLDSFDVNNINLTSVRDKSRFARIERVTRANKVELETRPKESSREKI